MRSVYAFLTIAFALASFVSWAMFTASRSDEVTLSRGAANKLEPSFSYTNDTNQIGGLYWRDDVIHYTDGAKEISREQLRARLNADQWAQVEEAERKGRPLTADEMKQ